MGLFRLRFGAMGADERWAVGLLVVAVLADGVGIVFAMIDATAAWRDLRSEFPNDEMLQIGARDNVRNGIAWAAMALALGLFAVDGLAIPFREDVSARGIIGAAIICAASVMLAWVCWKNWSDRRRLEELGRRDFD